MNLHLVFSTSQPFKFSLKILNLYFSSSKQRTPIQGVQCYYPQGFFLIVFVKPQTRNTCFFSFQTSLVLEQNRAIFKRNRTIFRNSSILIEATFSDTQSNKLAIFVQRIPFWTKVSRNKANKKKEILTDKQKSEYNFVLLCQSLPKECRWR